MGLIDGPRANSSPGTITEFKLVFYLLLGFKLGLLGLLKTSIIIINNNSCCWLHYWLHWFWRCDNCRNIFTLRLAAKIIAASNINHQVI